MSSRLPDIICPDSSYGSEVLCGQKVDIVSTYDLQSTDGPAPHARIRCLAGHVFDMLVENLPIAFPENFDQDN